MNRADAALSPNTNTEVYSPPMGGTFFTNVNLPSDEILRSGMAKPRFTFKGLVASASENLGLKPKLRHNPGSNYISNPKLLPNASDNRRKRNRAYTVTGTGPGTLVDNEIPPLPSFLPMESEVSYEAGEKMLFGGRSVDGRGEGKKGGGWKSLVKMLSKPQMDKT